MFSTQFGVDPESEFARKHRKRGAPGRTDGIPENAIHLDLQTFHGKEFLHVLDAQILLL